MSFLFLQSKLPQTQCLNTRQFYFLLVFLYWESTLWLSRSPAQGLADGNQGACQAWVLSLVQGPCPNSFRFQQNFLPCRGSTEVPFSCLLFGQGLFFIYRGYPQVLHRPSHTSGLSDFRKVPAHLERSRPTREPLFALT